MDRRLFQNNEARSMIDTHLGKGISNHVAFPEYMTEFGVFHVGAEKMRDPRG